VPWPWTYPSPFSAFAAFCAAVLIALCGFSFHPGRRSLAFTIAVFLFGTLAIWSVHQFIAFFQGISHGVPGWW
jgi:hypothetical protein